MADQDEQPPAEPTATSNIVHALLNDDDLVAVLRGQLFIEHVLEHLIAFATGESSRPLLLFMEFNSKINAAKELGVIHGHDVPALQAVAKMRNAFAHRLNRVLTKTDDAKMYTALRGRYKETYEQVIGAWHGSERYDQPGFGVRMAFTVIFRLLSERTPQHQGIMKAIEAHERPDLGRRRKLGPSRRRYTSSRLYASTLTNQGHSQQERVRRVLAQTMNSGTANDQRWRQTPDESDQRASQEWLSYLESATAVLYRFLERLAEAPPPKEKAFRRAIWAWSLFYGSMTFDVTHSTLMLLQAGHERAPTMLLRSLFEYAIRLRYYGVNEQEAIDGLKRAEAKMYHARKSTVGESYLKIIDDGYRSKMDAIIADPAMLAQKKFGFVRNTAVPEDGPAQKSMFLANYEQPSYFVHGDERLLEDVVTDPEGDNPQWLGATPPKVVIPNWICQHIAYQVLEVTNVLEWVLTTDNVETRLHFDALQALAERFGTRDKPPNPPDAE